MSSIGIYVNEKYIHPNDLLKSLERYGVEKINKKSKCIYYVFNDKKIIYTKKNKREIDFLNKFYEKFNKYLRVIRSGGIDSQDVVDIGTKASEVLETIPELLFPEDAAAAAIAIPLGKFIQELAPSKLLSSAKYYETTGIPGYVTDLIAKGYGHSANLNGNINDAINFESMIGNASNGPAQQKIVANLRNPLLEKPVSKDIIYPMPIRNSEMVYNYLVEWINKGFISEDNIYKYDMWNKIRANLPRNIPGTYIYETGDGNSLKLANAPTGSGLRRY